MSEIFGNATIFESPKPVGLISEIVKLGSSSDSVVLDFFSGSGSLGHAVMQQNAFDGSKRKFIVIQLPEPTLKDSEAGRAGYGHIAELTSERLRRAAKKICNENPLYQGDLGFRVFKLDSSNIQAWDPNPHDLPQSLHNSIDHLKADRTEQDVLFELLLKLGLELTVLIEQKRIAGKTVYAVGAGTLVVCLVEEIGSADVEPLALGIVDWQKALAPAGETRLVFRDSAFADDIAKTNLTAIFQQHGLSNIRSL